ncbi:TPA: lytic transglycosylase domain-containing protein [Kluyvera intermedia]|nr:lytic transglycosylase domain-containing protein [Kluyvera intermedia]
MQQRYDEKIGQLSGNLSTQISSPRLRAQFDDWATVQNARGQAQIRSMAWNKEKDTNIASLTQTLQDNSNSYMSSKDANEREQIAGATNNLISGAVAKNYINATQGQILSRNWVVDTAKGSLSLLTPQQRISQLQAGGGLTSFIPPDDRKRILDASAKEEVAGLEGRMMTDLLTPGWSGDANGNIDPNVLHAAMIQQESGGRHFDDKGGLITSPAGARGIGQIMPKTGEKPGFGIKPLQNDSPEEHLRVSREYADAMTKRYNGNPVLILASYNAGPGVVDDWINGTNKTGKNDSLIHLGDPSKGQISNEAFVNGIPFAETQNYVSSVLANATRAGMVKNVVGSQAFSLLDDADKATAIGKLYNTIDTATSAQRFNIGQQMENGIAMVNAGLEVKDPVTAGKFASTMPLNSTPAERAQMWQTFNQYQQTLSLQPAFQGIITSPRDVGQSIVNSMTPNANDADFAFKQQKQAAIQQKYSQTITARENDPAGWMVKNLPEVKDIYAQVQQDPSKTKDFVKAVMMQKQRLGIASQSVLPEAQAEQISQTLLKSTAAQQASILDGIHQFTGGGAAYSATMRQIAPKAPSTAVAGLLMDKATSLVTEQNLISPDIKVTPSQAAQTILIGGSARRGGEGVKGIQMPKDKDMRDGFSDIVKNAFSGDSSGAEMAYQTAQDFYAGVMQSKGDLSGEFDSSVWKQAVNVATGGVYDYNGMGSILLPWGMATDQFDKKVNQAWQDQVTNAGVKAPPGQYGLQSYGDSQYRVRLGAGYLLKSDGSPVILDLKQQKQRFSGDIPQ